MQGKVPGMNLIQCKFSFMLQDGLTDVNAKSLKTIPITSESSIWLKKFDVINKLLNKLTTKKFGSYYTICTLTYSGNKMNKNYFNLIST